MLFLPAELIKKKRRGEALSPDELRFLVDGYTRGEIPDYQMAAWLMAVCFQGLDDAETAQLTLLMRDSGRVLDFSHIPLAKVDKHSTGGVGDKTTLILAPLVASLGIPVPMIAGRGLGHTGGTLDKLESLKGFRIQLTEEEFRQNVERHHIAIMGQTERICPADRKIYALRDVTGTVDSLPLICASIMSKKMAEGLDALVLDVKYGSGAFMKTKESAIKLAELLRATGLRNGLRVAALITDMNQPLGRYAGNSLEVKECLDILQNRADQEFYRETRELSLRLAGYMIWLARRAKDADHGYALAKQQLESGAGFAKFEELCALQGCSDLTLPEATARREIRAERDGWLTAMDTERLGLAVLGLGAGRKVAADPVDPTAGIEFVVKLGQKVRTGDVLAVLYARTERAFQDAESLFRGALQWKDQADTRIHHPLVAEILV